MAVVIVESSMYSPTVDWPRCTAQPGKVVSATRAVVTAIRVLRANIGASCCDGFSLGNAGVLQGGTNRASLVGRRLMRASPPAFEQAREKLLAALQQRPLGPGLGRDRLRGRQILLEHARHRTAECLADDHGVD